MAAKLSDIGKIIAQALKSKPVLEEAAKVAVESIQLRTRIGKGVLEPEGDATPLPALATKTKYNRKLLVEETKAKVKVKKSAKERLKQLRRGNVKGALTSTKTKTVVTDRRFKKEVDEKNFRPAKSNLTVTGQLINSVKARVGKNKIEIFLDNELAQNKATWVQKIKPGFTFMNLSRAEVNRMIKAMSVEVTKILNKIRFDKF